VSSEGLVGLFAKSEAVVSVRNKMKPRFAAMMKNTESRKYVFFALIVKNRDKHEVLRARMSRS
jgi:hypothetical protein